MNCVSDCCQDNRKENCQVVNGVIMNGEKANRSSNFVTQSGLDNDGPCQSQLLLNGNKKTNMSSFKITSVLPSRPPSNDHDEDSGDDDTSPSNNVTSNYTTDEPDDRGSTFLTNNASSNTVITPNNLPKRVSHQDGSVPHGTSADMNNVALLSLKLCQGQNCSQHRPKSEKSSGQSKKALNFEKYTSKNFVSVLNNFTVIASPNNSSNQAVKRNVAQNISSTNTPHPNSSNAATTPKDRFKVVKIDPNSANKSNVDRWNFIQFDHDFSDIKARRGAKEHLPTKKKEKEKSIVLPVQVEKVVSSSGADGGGYVKPASNPIDLKKETERSLANGILNMQPYPSQDSPTSVSGCVERKLSELSKLLDYLYQRRMEQQAGSNSSSIPSLSGILGHKISGQLHEIGDVAAPFLSQVNDSSSSKSRDRLQNPSSVVGSAFRPLPNATVESLQRVSTSSVNNSLAEPVVSCGVESRSIDSNKLVERLEEISHKQKIYQTTDLAGGSRSNSTQSTQGAIDNRIEQAMDLVKSHLMTAVRSEMEELKEKITFLEDRVCVLQNENDVLKSQLRTQTTQQSQH